MGKTQLPLVNTKYSKEQLLKTKDRNFSTFLAPEDTFEPEISVSEFFELYEQLFFKIPPEGTSNSHRYLVNKSTTLLNMDQDTLDIQPLLDEIARLREELLAAKVESLTSADEGLRLKDIVKSFNSDLKTII